ncbi:MAG: FprA family A-type flavoprotein [Candidatus Omnitrophica bacterium]|nr:FprA family A-type flavoprotein [Candidatus Omnitrophota bacterium]
MKPTEIKKGIYWVGAIDAELRNFHGYLTQRGSTYNAYLIVDEKITLIDTVKRSCFDEMITRIKEIVDPAKIDYIVSNHVEMDHSGCLPKMCQLAPGAIVITSPNGEKGLRQHYNQNWNFKVVNSGDTVNIGQRNLSFVLTPMVHWPDSMVTYIPEEKLLLSNDAFGQHIASKERFDDQYDLEIIKSEAAKYYANIVLLFGAQVKKALDALSSLEIDIIAPSHGLIWRKHINNIIGLYKKWSNNETEEKAVIIYDTMWHSTEKIANFIKNAFQSKSIDAKVFSLQSTHISDIMAHLLSAKYICVGSPTLNNGLLPTVAAFTTYMQGLTPKNRNALSFGSYGWGGQSIKQIDQILSNCGFKTAEAIKIQYVPDENKLKEVCDDRIKNIISL